MPYLPSFIRKLMLSNVGNKVYDILNLIKGSTGAVAPDIRHKLLALTKLNPVERRALTYVNSGSFWDVINAPKDILNQAESARKKLQSLGLSRYTINRLLPDAHLITGKVYDKGLRKLDPLDYVFQIRTELSPRGKPAGLFRDALTEDQQLALLEASNQLLKNKAVYADSLLTPLIRADLPGRRFTNPIIRVTQPDLVRKGQEVAEKLMRLGISPETIQNTQWANLTTVPRINPYLIGTVGAGITGLGLYGMLRGSEDRNTAQLNELDREKLRIISTLANKKMNSNTAEKQIIENTVNELSNQITPSNVTNSLQLI